MCKSKTETLQFIYANLSVYIVQYYYYYYYYHYVFSENIYIRYKQFTIVSQLRRSTYNDTNETFLRCWHLTGKLFFIIKFDFLKLKMELANIQK